LADLQWHLEDTLLCEALEGLDLDGHRSEWMKLALEDYSQRLQSWAPSRRPLWRGFLEPLLRVYERASGRLPTASWTRPADGSKGRPASPFTRFVVILFEALPGDAQPFISASPEGVYAHAKTLIGERRRAWRG
jgi:hypothetical protein